MFNYLIAIFFTSVISYLLGSVNFSIIITKRTKQHADIRTMGSGNAGFTNVLRSVGKIPAILTILGDFSKGIIAILLGKLIFSSEFLFGNQSSEIIQYGSYLAGFFCFLGHIYPCFFNFKGGKGIVTTVSIVWMIDWRVFAISMGAFLVCLIFSRIVSLSSLIAAFTFVLSLSIINYFINYKIYSVSIRFVIISFVYSLIIFLFILYSHRSNISRLLNGTEKKLKIKKN